MKINIANYCGTNMMPKTKAPLHSHKNPVIDCRYPSIRLGLKGNRSCYTSAYTYKLCVASLQSSCIINL